MIRQKLAKTFKITMCSGHFAVFPALENLSCQGVRGLVNWKYQRARCQKMLVIRGRCRKHFFQILSRHMFFFVFLNFKRGFFSWTFWFGASFICKNAHLCLHADLHGEVGQNILNGQTNMLTRRTSDFSVTYHLQIPLLLL